MLILPIQINFSTSSFSTQNWDSLQYPTLKQTTHRNLIKQNKTPEVLELICLVPKDYAIVDNRAIFWLEQNSIDFQIQGQFSPNHIIFIELQFYSTNGFYDERQRKKWLILPTQQIDI